MVRFLEGGKVGGGEGVDHELERAASNEVSPFSRILFPLQLRQVSDAVVNSRLFFFFFSLGTIFLVLRKCTCSYAILHFLDSQDLCVPLGKAFAIQKV